jgi:hypothetical protein
LASQRAHPEPTDPEAALAPLLASTREYLRQGTLQDAADTLTAVLRSTAGSRLTGPLGHAATRLLRILQIRIDQQLGGRSALQGPVAPRAPVLRLVPLADALASSWQTLLHRLPDRDGCDTQRETRRQRRFRAECGRAIARLACRAGRWLLVWEVAEFVRVCGADCSDLTTLEIRALNKLQRVAEAVAVGVSARQRHPGHPGIAIALAEALTTSGDLLRAASHLYSCHRQTGSPEVMLALARMQRCRGQARSARCFYRLALEQPGDFLAHDRWLAHLELADLYLHAGESDAAALQLAQARHARFLAGWSDAAPIDEFMELHQDALPPPGTSPEAPLLRGHARVPRHPELDRGEPGRSSAQS